jgi:hypothetical protein
VLDGHHIDSRDQLERSMALNLLGTSARHNLYPHPIPRPILPSLQPCFLPLLHANHLSTPRTIRDPPRPISLASRLTPLPLPLPLVQKPTFTPTPAVPTASPLFSPAKARSAARHGNVSVRQVSSEKTIGGFVALGDGPREAAPGKLNGERRTCRSAAVNGSPLRGWRKRHTRSGCSG